MIRIHRSPWIFLLALFAAANAEAAELHGTVLENEIGGVPMVGVQIKATGSNPTTSKNLGSFKLVLPNRKPGEAVTLTVSKEGYLVVNDIQLETTLPLEPEARPLTLLLCKPAACEEMRRRFYRLKGTEAVEASYQRQLLELERRNLATAAERDRLRQERDRALAAAEKAAEELARIRPAESSEMYQKALRLFLEGRASEALVILDDAKLQRSLEAARFRKAEADREIEQAVQGYLLRGQILISQLDFAAAERAYRTAVENAPENFEAHFALAYFFDSQKRYTEATAGYGTCLKIARNQGNLANTAATLNNLGNLLRDQNRLDEARKAYDEALELRRQLAKKNPDLYLPEVATTLNSLGILLRDQHRLDEARKAYDEALKLQRQLAEKNPDVYLPGVATTLNNLGVLLRDQNRLDEARKAYDEALEKYRQLAEKNPDVYLPDAATTLNNLGVLLSLQNRLDEARKAFDEALELQRRLAEKNPDVYLPDVATTLNNLGNLLSGQNRLDEARKAYDEALELQRQLAKKNPDVYLPDVAMTLNNLGLLQIDENPAAARRALTEALEIRRKLASVHAEAFAPDVANTLGGLALIAITEGRSGDARLAVQEGLRILEPFAIKNPEAFQGKLDTFRELMTLIEEAENPP